MATVNCTDTSGLVTLSGTTVDTVNMNAGPFDVCNWTGATDLTVTYAVNGGSAATPVAGAAETWAVPAGTSRRIEGPLGAFMASDVIQVKVLGNGNVYSIDGAG